MDAQFQIRQNAMEAQDFMQDLLSWQHALKEKSSKSKQQSTADASVPAVRGRAAGSVSVAPDALQRPANAPGLAKSAVGSTAPPAAHTYKNYSKWDQFDVDAALQEDTTASSAGSKHPQPPATTAKQSNGHAQSQQPNGLGNGSSAAPNVAQPLPPTAAALKDRGNKLYQAGYYTDAISCYTQSIDLQPTSVAYANRAMAELRLKQYEEAEQDCSAALQLDPTYVKALHRRGTARKQLGNLLEAAVDFEEALRLEPSNKTLSADRDDAVQQYLQQEKIPLNSMWSSIPIQQQMQSAKADQQQPGAAAAAVQSPAAAVVEHVPASSSQAAGIPVSEQQGDKGAAAPEPVVAAPAGSLPMGAGVSKSPSQVTPAAAAAATTATAADMKHKTSIVGANNTVPAQASKPPSTATAAAASAAVSSPPRQPTSVSAAAAAAAAQLAARLSAGLRPPRNSNDFEAAWRSFKGDQGLQAKYLKLVSPQQLPTVFKTSLTAPILTAVITIALNAVVKPVSADDSGNETLDAAHAVALIEQMVKVPRFDMTAMCLTSRDKASLKQLWDAAEAACDGGSRSTLEGLRAKYRLR